MLNIIWSTISCLVLLNMSVFLLVLQKLPVRTVTEWCVCAHTSELVYVQVCMYVCTYNKKPFVLSREVR